MSTVRAWSAEDQIAAATDIANADDRCPGCGLADDAMPFVEVDADRCPACEARDRLRESTMKAGGVEGMLLRFYPVTDSRSSVWAQFAQKGREWASKHRSDPDGLLYTPPAD